MIIGLLFASEVTLEIATISDEEKLWPALNFFFNLIVNVQFLTTNQITLTTILIH